MGPNEWLDSNLVNIAADVKSLLCSKDGRILSIDCRILSYDGLALSIDGRGIGGSSDDRCRVKSVPSLPFWLRGLWVVAVGATEGG